MGEMMLTGENRNARRNTPSSLTWTDLGSNPGVRPQRQATNRLSGRTDLI